MSNIEIPTKSVLNDLVKESLRFQRFVVWAGILDLQDQVNLSDEREEIEHALDILFNVLCKASQNHNVLLNIAETLSIEPQECEVKNFGFESIDRRGKPSTDIDESVQHVIHHIRSAKRFHHRIATSLQNSDIPEVNTETLGQEFFRIVEEKEKSQELLEELMELSMVKMSRGVL